MSIIGAQNLRLGTNKGLEVLSGRDLAVKVDSHFSLGAGGIAPDLTATWTFAADKLQISSDGSGANDPVRYSQFAAFGQGLRIKDNVRVATNAALPAYTPAGSVLTMDAVGILTVDGVNLVLNDRVTVKNESGASEKYNGFYKVTTEGTAGVAAVLTRAIDGDTAAELREGSFAYVEEGTANNGKRFAITVGPTTLNTDAVTFTEIPAQLATAGAGLTMTGTTLDIVAADASIVVAADSIRVGFDGSGGLELNSGVGARIKLDGATLALSSSGIKIPTGGVTATELGSGAVTPTKIGTAAVTQAKLAGIRRFERLVGVAANGATFTLARAVVAGAEEGVQVTEDGADIDYVSASPDTSPSKEFTVSGATLTLGFTQVENAVYRVWYVSEAA